MKLKGKKYFSVVFCMFVISCILFSFWGIENIYASGEISTLEITGPPSVVAETPFNVTVKALDSSGNVNPGYTGKVSFASSDNTAGLPQDYTFKDYDFGVKTFQVTLNTLGNHTISVSDPFNGLVAAGILMKGSAP